MAVNRQAKLSDQQLRLIADALSEPRRFQILQQIGKCNGSLACSDIRETFAITPATVSHHMKELEEAGLVESARHGKFTHYRLRRDVLDAYIQTLSSI